MQLGAENRTKLVVMLALAAIAIVLFLRMLFGASAASAPDLPPSTSAAAPPAHRGPRTAARGPRLDIDPSLRLDMLGASEETTYKGSGRNIFKAELDLPKIPRPVAAARTMGPPPPPAPPPINLRFFGFANKPGEPRKAFLSQGDDVFIAGEGEIVDRRYKVLRIGPNSVDILDVLNNNQQTIALIQG